MVPWLKDEATGCLATLGGLRSKRTRGAKALLALCYAHLSPLHQRHYPDFCLHLLVATIHHHPTPTSMHWWGKQSWGWWHSGTDHGDPPSTTAEGRHWALGGRAHSGHPWNLQLLPGAGLTPGRSLSSNVFGCTTAFVSAKFSGAKCNSAKQEPPKCCDSSASLRGTDY